MATFHAFPLHFPTWRRWLFVLAAIAALGFVRLTADEVYLKDGRVLDGEVFTEPGDETVHLRTGSGSMVLIQHFKPAQVDHVVYGKSFRQTALEQIAAKRTELGDEGSADQWWKIVEMAREIGDSTLVRELSAVVVVRDRQHAGARKVLGMSKVKGVWMRPAEAALARGDVQYDGRWMSWKDRQEALLQKEKRVELAQARRQAAARRAALNAEGYQEPYPGLNSLYPQPHVLYWPGFQGNGNYTSYSDYSNSGSGLSVHASGGGSHNSWSFSWNP